MAWTYDFHMENYNVQDAFHLIKIQLYSVDSRTEHHFVVQHYGIENLFSTISHNEDNLEKFASEVIFVHFWEISVQFKFRRMVII